MHIQFAKEATSAYEYGCDLRRLYPWGDLIDPLWGSAIASVRPSESTTPHSHDEHETFLILSGRGLMSVDDETSEVSTGDLIYLPPNSYHTIKNLSDEERLDFLTIFWGSPEANERMIEMSKALMAVHTAD
jgi:methionyl-tRNA synthetase